MECASTFVKIDLDAILQNLRSVRNRAGAMVMAVVKADAYGHGAVPVAKHIEQESDFFGVSSVAEALELCHAGIVKPIMILGHTPKHTFPVVVKHGIRTGIFSYEDAQALSREAVRQGKTAYIHFVLDTGMSRIGFQPTQESADICRKISQLPGIMAEGLFSHFATADEPCLEKTKAQADRFDTFDKMLRDRGVEVPLRHLDNSAGVMNFGSHYEMVRAGIVLYGLYPSETVDPDLLPLVPALSWHTEVSYVKWLEPGREISYGGTFVTDRPMLVATLPVGYADGYRRSLSGKFYVLIRGKQAPILGRICMDQLMVDVTHIPDIQMGEAVVLIGSQGDARISAEAIAAAADSFNYEQICGVSRRITRVYLKEGKETERINYLLDK